MKITSATLNKYNANSRGNNAPDCVKRAISIAFDLPYNEISKMLLEKAGSRKVWNIPSVYRQVIKQLGGSEFKPLQQGSTGLELDDVTLDEFADVYADPNKTYILEVGKSYPKPNHLVTVRNGEIWDSWDSRNRIVCKYCTLSDSVQHKALTNIKEDFEELLEDHAREVLQKQATDYLNKHGMEGWIGLESYNFKDYRIDTRWKLTLPADDFIPKNRVYKIVIPLVFEPTMTKEQAVEYINKTGKQKMYDRMWTIKENEKKVFDEAMMAAQLGTKDDNMKHLYVTPQEEKFINTLPGWVRPLIEFISIDRPNQYSDSYSIKLRPLHNDDRHGKLIYLTAYDADTLREYIDTYKRTGDVEGVDYFD